MDSRLMVIRTDDDSKEWIWNQIKQAKLHQGWGLPGTRLVKDGKQIGIQDWIKAYQNSAITYWDAEVPDDEAEKRYWILYPLTELKKGDVVVVPKMPDWSSFIISSVSDVYDFEEEEAGNRNGMNDYRHYIPIDPEKIKIFNYASCEEARIVSKKLRAYQSAVNNVWNDQFRKATFALFERDSDTDVKNIKDIFYDVRASILNPLLERVRNLRFNDLEELVADLFEANGFEITERNVYDGAGGDVDIVAIYKLPLISEHSDVFHKTYIQVKQKDGKDWNDSEGVIQLHNITKLEPNAQKILISTVDEFSEKTKALASEYSVILISGLKLVDMLNRNL